MPLLVPGVNSNAGDDLQTWMTKLAGKKIGDKHDDTNFARQDLPQDHRILDPGSMSTMDFKPERLNVHVGNDGTVTKVTKG